ncbi:nuclear transport factor 2 family protein [Metabacillus fastidiosus]|uniref:nuclear transport factor 2 family protein n=1 Tax=Metabacillus fastidiosus TaxID=1458 RepID=UPI002E2304AF|nr:nuclear transport factor 2 family protein [Metabacillus fastidiosus]
MEENVIYEYEERLRKAMVNGDVESLDKLISDELTFVSHIGQRFTKEADIEAHRSGILNITEISFLNQKVIPLEDAAVIITQAKVKAIFAEEHMEDELYYTRVWRMDKNELKVISGHCSSVQKLV